MSSRPGTNPNVSQIPQPMADVGSLAYCLQQVKQALDSLAGFRGPASNRAVTFDDLVSYGIIAQLNLTAPSVPSGTATALSAEAAARTNADVILGGEILAETTRAEAAEAALTTALSSVTSSSSTNTGAIAAETTRATGAEGTLTANLAAEVTRATNAEALKTPLTTANVGQYKGTTTNDNATAGNIGEYVSASVVLASAVSLVTATPKDVTSITLTPGDWDVHGTVAFAISGTCNNAQGWTSATSATVPAFPNGGSYTTLVTSSGILSGCALPVGNQRFSLAVTTTIYLTAYAAFTSTQTAYGFISARRMR